MEARISDADKSSFLDLPNLENKSYLELKSAIDNLSILVKHETSDIRKELTYLSTKQESAEIKYQLHESMKNLEMKIYAFIVKAVVSTVGIITAIQPIFSFLTK